MTQSEVDQLRQQVEACDKRRNYALWCELRRRLMLAQAQLYQEQHNAKPRQDNAR